MEPSSTVPMDIKIIIFKLVENTSICPEVLWKQWPKTELFKWHLPSAEENN